MFNFPHPGVQRLPKNPETLSAQGGRVNRCARARHQPEESRLARYHERHGMGSSEDRLPLLTSRKTVALIILLYAGVSLVILMDALPHHFLDLARWMPRWVGLIVVSAIGPAVLLTGGIAALNWYAGSLLSIAACLALTWLAWRQWPDSELFVVGMLAAGALWVGSAWLIVAIMW
jgi:hypothetical protein